MKTWKEKFNNGKEPEIKVIDKFFAGMPAGSKMLISSPRQVDGYIRTLPVGEFTTPKEMRAQLAKTAGADTTCPTSTGIFLRIVCEAAYEDHLAGMSLSEITPFWRVVEPKSTLAKKLACSIEFVEQQRANESSQQ